MIALTTKGKYFKQHAQLKIFIVSNWLCKQIISEGNFYQNLK